MTRRQALLLTAASLKHRDGTRPWSEEKEAPGKVARYGKVGALAGLATSLAAECLPTRIDPWIKRA